MFQGNSLAYVTVQPKQSTRAKRPSQGNKENQMNVRRFLTVAAVTLSFVATGALAEDKAKMQAEVRAKAEQSLNDFYKAQPSLKAAVQKAPGYAVFTTYGFSFLLGGAGGKGLVHDNKTKKNTYMELGAASAGLQIGAEEERYLFIFKDAKAMQHFIDSGWLAGTEGGAGAGTGTKATGGTAGLFTGGEVYSLTKKGFQAAGNVSGIKVWKDKALN
jgi:lipid-binding SYLF domain-containing protein